MTPKTPSSPKPGTVAHVQGQVNDLKLMLGDLTDPKDTVAANPEHEARWKARQAQEDAVNSSLRTTQSVLLNAIRAESTIGKGSTLRIKNLAAAVESLSSALRSY